MHAHMTIVRRIDDAVLIGQLTVLTGTEWMAVGETVILLHPPLPLAGVSIGMERGRH